MGAKRRGFEGQLFYGTAGTTGAIQITNATDLAYNTEPEMAETTVRGVGTNVPIVGEDVVAIKPTITFTMLNDETDTALTALLAAARTGAAVSMRTKSISTGKGYDGDVKLKANWSAGLKDQQQYEFEATAYDALRTPLLNA